jgi:hypothetical protein
MINITDADRKVAKKLAQFGKLIPEYKIAEIIAIEMQLERERAIKRRMEYESEAAAKLQAADRLANAVEMFIGDGNTCPHGVPLSGNTGYCSCETYQLSEWYRVYRETTK